MKKSLHRQLGGLHNFVYKSVLKAKQIYLCKKNHIVEDSLVESLFGRVEERFFSLPLQPNPRRLHDLNFFLTITAPLSLPSIFSKKNNLHSCTA